VFSGDLEISSRNKSGPTIDLNIMTRRGQFSHSMRRIGGGRIKILHPGTILMFNSTANVATTAGNVTLERFDALIADPDDGALDVGQEADVLVIEVTAQQS
jgi:environmental stress-induced protein Ves